VGLGRDYYGSLGLLNLETCEFGSGGSENFPCSRTPMQVGNLTGVTAVAAGYSQSLALKNNGTVWPGVKMRTVRWEMAPRSIAPHRCRSRGSRERSR